MVSIALKGIHKSYSDGVSVIRDVNLQIAESEFCVIIGPSGCGKSTLLRMIAGLENITDGELHIDERCVNDLAPSERNVAMVFQNYALYPHMDVAANISFGLRLLGHSKTEIKSRVDRIAKILKIEPLLDRKPRALSGGQRQRVAIGRALVRDPGVFLFDEPMSNLDAGLRTQTRLEIAKLHREYGKASTVYVTHDQVEAMTLADKIVLLHTGDDVARHGSVAQVGSPMELYNQPRNLFVAGFIGSPKMNFIPGQVVRIDGDGVMIRTRTDLMLKAMVATGDLAMGTMVTLGVRSEHLRLQTERGDNTMPCRIQWVEHLGDVTYAHLESPQENALVIRLPSDSPVTVNDAVHLYIPPLACHLFDPDGIAVRRLRN